MNTWIVSAYLEYLFHIYTMFLFHLQVIIAFPYWTVSHNVVDATLLLGIPSFMSGYTLSEKNSI